MRRPHLGMLFALACVPILAITALASATPQIGEKSNGLSITDERYLHVYVDCWDAFKAQCGRNIVDDGLSSGKVPSEGRVQRSIDTMDSWLNPPAPTPPIDSPSISTAAPAATSYAPAPTTSAGGCPSYMAAEATSPDAVNPTSGAAGCYQILPSTQAAHGCADVGPECAAVICATEGPGAWAASGANPCPYVQP